MRDRVVLTRWRCDSGSSNMLMGSVCNEFLSTVKSNNYRSFIKTTDYYLIIISVSLFNKFSKLQAYENLSRFYDQTPISL